jgi:hypothetical protein
MASFMTTGNEDVDLSGAYISLMQLMTHELDGNHVDQLKSARDEINEYLISR